MTLETTLDEMQKRLMLIKFLGLQGLSLAIGPLVGAEGSIPKALQKQSQVERLRKELDEQISRCLATQGLPAAEVRALRLISRLGNGIDAMGREVLRIGELAHGPALSRKVAGRVLELFETGGQVLNHSVIAFFELGTAAAAPSLRRAEDHAEKLAGMLERSQRSQRPHQAEEGSALIAAISRMALEAQSARREIAAFVAAYTLEKVQIAGSGKARGIWVGRS